MDSDQLCGFGEVDTSDDVGISKVELENKKRSGGNITRCLD